MNRLERPHDPTATAPDALRRRRLLILGGLAALILLTLVGVGIFGLLRGPSEPAATPTPVAGEPTRRAFAPAVLPETRDAEVFAEVAARHLFTWDAGLEHGPADYQQPLVDAGHPDEVIALATDLRGYYPDAGTWGELRQMQTRQWLTITSIGIPAGWETAQAQARSGQLPEGTVAYTIDGTRHRTGTWGTELVAYEAPVSFTIFIACPHEGECLLLRLSAVDQPLR